MKWKKGLLLALLCFCLPIQKDYKRPKLYINTSPKHYVLNISQQDGEQDLKRLVFSSPVEEFWVYWKKKGKEIGMWEECGENETESSVQATFDLKKYKDAEEIVLYHIHPNKCTANNAAMAESFSWADLFYFADFAVKAYKRLGIKNVELKIFVPSGIYELSLNKDALRSKEDLEKKAYKALREFASKKDLFNDYLWNCKNDNSKINKRFAKVMKKLGDLIEVEFVSYK
jgi:hypothetical protein